MKTVISIKVDEEVKGAAQEVAKSAGLTLSALVNAFLVQLVATRRIEFFAPEQMSPRLESLIGEAEEERYSGTASKAFDDVEEFLEDLKR